MSRGAVCEFGHIAASGLLSARDQEEFGEDPPETDPRLKFCAECGAPVLLSCPSCHAEIRGLPHYLSFEIPSFCSTCSKPFPWVSKAIEASIELIETLSGLTPTERQDMAALLPALVSDSPRTQPAALKFRRLLDRGAKSLPSLPGLFERILSNLVATAIKDFLFKP